MGQLSVYKQLAASPDKVFEALRNEIGMKTDCMPFAMKLTNAMRSLVLKTAEEEHTAATTLLSGMQTLAQGGILPEDYDKIDFVKRGKTIVPSARVEAFYRAAARKGYRIFDDIIAVPKEDSATTYFLEHFHNGEYVYTLSDARKNLDRTVTAERLVKGYFARFMCRLTVREVKTNSIIAVSVCEMSSKEMLDVSNTGEQGIYKSKWEEYKDGYGRTKKRKVISDELNSGTFWTNWTGEMVKKTIIRRALKRIKEVLPDLKETIYAFAPDDFEDSGKNNLPENIPDIDIPVEKTDDVDLNNLTEEQKGECSEMFKLYCKNPKLAADDAARIKELFENGKTVQEVINTDYASIMALRKSPAKWSEIGGYFVEEDKDTTGDT